MKRLCFLIPTILVLSDLVVNGQGTFVYDQQSSNETFPGEALVGITSFQQPVGQSFTPTLAAVGFIRLQLLDGNPGNGLGASIVVNLRTNSITGPVLAVSIPVFLPDTFAVVFTNFVFSTPVQVTPGLTYYFQPVIQSGDGVFAGRFIPGPNYSGGTEFINGLPGSNDLWFREGIVVPEPQLGLLVLAAGAILCLRHRCEGTRSSCASSV